MGPTPSQPAPQSGSLSCTPTNKLRLECAFTWPVHDIDWNPLDEEWPCLGHTIESYFKHSYHASVYFSPNFIQRKFSHYHFNVERVWRQSVYKVWKERFGPPGPTGKPSEGMWRFFPVPEEQYGEGTGTWFTFCIIDKGNGEREAERVKMFMENRERIIEAACDGFRFSPKEREDFKRLFKWRPWPDYKYKVIKKRPMKEDEWLCRDEEDKALGRVSYLSDSEFDHPKDGPVMAEETDSIRLPHKMAARRSPLGLY